MESEGNGLPLSELDLPSDQVDTLGDWVGSAAPCLSDKHCHSGFELDFRHSIAADICLIKCSDYLLRWRITYYLIRGDYNMSTYGARVWYNGDFIGLIPKRPFPPWFEWLRTSFQLILVVVGHVSWRKTFAWRLPDMLVTHTHTGEKPFQWSNIF